MKNNEPFRRLYYRHLKKTLLIMRIAIILLLVGFFQTRANDAYSQKTRLSINFSNTELGTVLDKIENQSEFFFLYNEKLIDANRKVSIDAKNEGRRNRIGQQSAWEAPGVHPRSRQGKRSQGKGRHRGSEAHAQGRQDGKRRPRCHAGAIK